MQVGKTGRQKCGVPLVPCNRAIPPSVLVYRFLPGPGGFCWLHVPEQYLPLYMKVDNISEILILYIKNLVHIL